MKQGRENTEDEGERSIQTPAASYG